MQQSHSLPQERTGYVATIKSLFRLALCASPLLLLGLLVLTLLGGLAPPLAMLVSARLIDTIVKAAQAPQPAATLPWALVNLLLLLAGLSLAEQLIGRVRAATERLYQQRVTNHIRLLIAKKAASLDLACFENPTFHNQLRNATAEASYRPMNIITQLISILSGLSTIVSVGAILLVWRAWVVPPIALSALALFVVSRRFGSATVTLSLSQTPEARRAQYFGSLLASDTAAKDVRLFGLCNWLLAKYRHLLDDLYRQDRQLLRRQTLVIGSVEVVLTAVRPIFIGFAAFQAIAGLLSVGQFSLYTQAIGQLYSGLYHLAQTLVQLHQNTLFVANLFHFLALQPVVEAPRRTAAPRNPEIDPTPHIEFRDVSFRYSDASMPVVDRLSFHIYPGEAIALVGENGAGKTTIVKLLAGLYHPTAGQILFDGVDITTLDPAELRAHLSVIFQDYPIYHFSLHDNIGIGRVDQIDDRVRVMEAARSTGLDRIVAGLPDGYETIVGRWFERGHELSGGQRQLVALSRALVRGAPVLVLDEPAAALDAGAEQHFFQNLLDEQRSGNQSIMFISHRFSTVRRADRILVLEHGRVIEQGTHAELMMLQGHYADLFTLQAEMYHDPSALESARAISERLAQSAARLHSLATLAAEGSAAPGRYDRRYCGPACPAHPPEPPSRRRDTLVLTYETLVLTDEEHVYEPSDDRRSAAAGGTAPQSGAGVLHERQLPALKGHRR
jgi:ATP-binding cassette, subfamily B, bacterial